MALGKAFIEVHADTRPFARELGRELDKIVKAADKEVKMSARKVGETISKETGEGVKKDSKRLRRDIESGLGGLAESAFGRFTKGIIDTIDDGISGLPDEIKIVLGAALIAVAPIILGFAAALVSSITAAIGIGLAGGLAALLGSQFVEVQDQFQIFLTRIREDALGATRWLAGPILAALDMIEQRFSGLIPAISKIAEIGSTLFEPLIDAVFGLVESALPGIISGFGNLREFMLPLQVGLRGIGEAVGQFFDEILNNPQAVSAFYDLLVFVEDLVRVFTVLVQTGLFFYGVLRKVMELTGFYTEQKAEVHDLGRQYGLTATSATAFGEAIDGTISPLESETEAVEGLNKELQTYTNLLVQSITNQIDFEEQIDQLSESVKENGRSLDIGSKAGRANANILVQMAQNALATRQNTIDLTGDITNSQIEFQKQGQAIYDVAKQMKLSEAQVKNLIGSLLLIPPPMPTGVDQGSINRLQAYYELIEKIRDAVSAGDIFKIFARSVGAQYHADGGVFTQPHMGVVAEAGPEAIIPLNNPARAAQVMNEAGLGGMASPSVNVYIGNQQLDSYIDSRVDNRVRVTARSLSYGTRTP